MPPPDTGERMVVAVVRDGEGAVFQIREEEVPAHIRRFAALARKEGREPVGFAIDALNVLLDDPEVSERYLLAPALLLIRSSMAKIRRDRGVQIEVGEDEYTVSELDLARAFESAGVTVH